MLLLTEESSRGEQITEDAKSFYVEWECECLGFVAQVGGRRRRGCCMGVIFPYVMVEAEWSDKELEGYEMDGERRRRTVYRENALRLFPRFAGK